MRSPLLPKGLTRQTLAVLIFVALAGIVGVSLAAWRAERQALEEQVSGKLLVVANLKRDQLNNWLTERTADARLVAVNRLNQEHFTELFEDSIPQPRKEEFAAFLRDNLIGLQRSRAGYVEIAMTDKAGNVVIGTNPDRLGKQIMSPEGEWFKMSSIDGGFLCDIHRHWETNQPIMIFGHVIRAIDLNTHEESKEVIGEVIIVVDMAETIYRLLGPMQELGGSAESLLVRPTQNGFIFLSNLLFAENAPLQLIAPPESAIAQAALQARMGQNAPFHSTDYAGEPVIAAFRQIEPVGWGLVVKQAEAEAFAPIRQLAERIALLTTLVLMGTVLLALFLARALIRPISALARATQTIAAGDLSVSLQSGRNDELGALSASFQRMVEALIERRAETQRLTDMLQRRADELESAYRDLRRSDQLKDAFIRNITHELRTPIATLSGYTELLMDNVDEYGEEEREMLEVVADQSAQVARLVNDVVAIHNLTVGEPERRPLRLVELVRASLDACQRREAGHNPVNSGHHDFELHYTDTDLEVLADPGQITRVLDNLLDNAVKFSPDGGLIHIGIRRVQKWCGAELTADWQVVSVADSGVGISREHLPRIWERFYQADHSTTRRFGGTGLGLALVKETVESHGGEVWAESEPGEGTIISFSLPVHQPTAPLPATTEAPVPAPAFAD